MKKTSTGKIVLLVLLICLVLTFVYTKSPNGKLLIFNNLISRTVELKSDFYDEEALKDILDLENPEFSTDLKQELVENKDSEKVVEMYDKNSRLIGTFKVIEPFEYENNSEYASLDKDGYILSFKGLKIVSY